MSASMWCLAALVVGSVCEWHMGNACKGCLAGFIISAVLPV